MKISVMDIENTFFKKREKYKTLLHPLVICLFLKQYPSLESVKHKLKILKIYLLKKTMLATIKI